jgi:hypothetical protein
MSTAEAAVRLIRVLSALALGWLLAGHMDWWLAMIGAALAVMLTLTTVYLMITEQSGRKSRRTTKEES